MEKDKICIKSGKISHQSKRKANAHLKSIEENSKNPYDGCSYPCIYCNGWHVGRFKKKAHKNKYRH